MKERLLPIAAELWVEILKSGREQHFKVVKNGLPEDAKAVSVEARRDAQGNLRELMLVVTSAVFREDDPDLLPDVQIQSLHPATGPSYQPRKGSNMRETIQ